MTEHAKKTQADMQRLERELALLNRAKCRERKRKSERESVCV